MNQLNNPIFKTDFYKTGHIVQYPEGTQKVLSNLTARSNKYMPNHDKVVFFGLQGFLKKLVNDFNEYFFGRDIEEVVNEYKVFIESTLGVKEYNVDHIKELHLLGYLPLEVKALKEGTKVPMRVPMLTIENTDDRFYWLTNYIETYLSASLWKPITSATIANGYREVFEEYAENTGASKEFIPFQGHDFSYRGMGSDETAQISGAAHLLSFVGTDTIPAILYLNEYYGGDYTQGLVGTSIPATEHSVMCAGGIDNEFETIERLITKVYPSGLVSIVSDTWDFFGALENIYKPLKDKIMAREGKVVIRPDSGDPVKIICGDPEATTEHEFKGAVEILWEIFGGTTNEQGFKTLDAHIGLIYGDSITPDRQRDILETLAAKGFASDNIVLGIGSYTYNYNTRDSFGQAVKATNVVINDEETPIFKDPKTDGGMKKSAKGRVSVYEVDGELTMEDNGIERLLPNLLEQVFIDGVFKRLQSLEEIRELLKQK